jgi:hypothetical protein
MLSDSLFVYFVGHDVPFVMVSVSGCIILFFFIVMTRFFTYARPEKQHYDSLLIIAGLFMMIVGLAYLSTSFLLASNVRVASNHLYENACDNAGAYRVLMQTSRKLQALRALPVCASMDSVEACPGFERTLHSRVLKTMEQALSCSGFCYSAAADSGSIIIQGEKEWKRKEATKAAAANVSMLLALNTRHHKAPAHVSSAVVQHNTRRVRTKLSRLHGNRLPHQRENAATLLQINQETASNSSSIATAVISKNYEVTRPATLFSQANHRGSCDGMTGRHIASYDLQSAVLLLSGIFLLTVGTLTNGISLCCRT